MNTEEDLKGINQIIAASFGKVSESVLAAVTVSGLFENLLHGIEREFSVPFVWLTLIENEFAGQLINAFNASEILKNRFSVVSADFIRTILPADTKPVLANRDLKPFYRLLPSERKYFVKSIAVVPFTIGGQLAGTWNNGDADANRYESDMKTDYIENLSAQISRRLDEIISLTADEAGSRPDSTGGRP